MYIYIYIYLFIYSFIYLLYSKSYTSCFEDSIFIVKHKHEHIYLKTKGEAVQTQTYIDKAQTYWRNSLNLGQSWLSPQGTSFQ